MMPVFQANLTSQDIGLGNPAVSVPGGSILVDVLLPVLVVGGIVLLALAAAFLLTRRHFRNKFRHAMGVGRIVMRVTVPKESSEKGGAGMQEKTLADIKEDIAVAEGLFESVGGLKADRGLKAWFLGREDTVSFEIVAEEGVVSFYIVAPTRFRDFIEQQLHSQYPLAQVEDVGDYNIFPAQGSIAATQLRFKNANYFPIKTYKQLESDPLNAITNSLSKVAEEDGAALQIVVRSARSGWRSMGVKLASLMQQGMPLREAKKKAGPFGFLAGSSRTQKEGEPPKEYKLSQTEEEMVKSIEEKVGKLGLDANIRIVAGSKSPVKAKQYVDNIAGAFTQFNSPQYGNAFSRMTGNQKKLIRDFIFRSFNEKGSMVLAGHELASVYHMPLASTETPNIRWLAARKPPPPSNLPSEGLELGYVNFRGKKSVVRIKQEDRRRHMYVIGKSGTGKSVLLENMIKQDIEAGRGVCVMDPHGDLARAVIGFVPKERAEDVIYFNPADAERPMGLNMMEYDPKYPEQKTFVVNEMLKIFDKLYDLKSTGGPMFEQYMRNAMILVMDHPESGSTLLEIPRVLTDEKFRAYKLSKCKTEVVRNFWLKEAQKAGGEASLANMVPYITSKLTPFITNDLVRPIIGQQKSAFNLREVMDNQKILLLDLSKGKLGDLNAYLIGMVMVGKIVGAALGRTDMAKEERKDFYLYIDEFQNFITDSISVILSEARKYALDLIIAHQFIGQLEQGGDSSVRDAVFGNVGSMLVGRIGSDDAEFLEKEMQPTFSAFDLVNVEAYTYNTKLLIDNTGSKPFNMNAFPPQKVDSGLVEAIKQLSRLKFGRDRDIVEAEIQQRMRAGGM